MNKPTACDLAQVVQDRRLDQEDFDIQVEAAREAVARGHLATARAQLRGAMLILDTMERRLG